ncbi:unnamed protein product, partial [Symbiodinium sp. CCMP2456]
PTTLRPRPPPGVVTAPTTRTGDGRALGAQTRGQAGGAGARVGGPAATAGTRSGTGGSPGTIGRATGRSPMRTSGLGAAGEVGHHRTKKIGHRGKARSPHLDKGTLGRHGKARHRRGSRRPRRLPLSQTLRKLRGTGRSPSRSLQRLQSLWTRLLHHIRSGRTLGRTGRAALQLQGSLR